MLSDSILAYAILMSLPESYTTLVQTYYLANTSSSADVLSAVRTEWHRRTGEVNKAAALAAKVRISTPTPTPSEPTVFKHCSLHGECAHTTKECNVLKARAKAGKGEARIAASSLEPNESASATAALASVSLSPAQAFLATISLDPVVLLASSSALDVVIDLGASHHMVHDRNLLTDIVPLSARYSITVGNGETIQASEVGRLTLKHTHLDHVLVVP
jgi:hypothetical protein